MKRFFVKTTGWAALLLLAVACNNEGPKGPVKGADASDAAPASTATGSPSSASSSGAAAACATDSDCATHSSCCSDSPCGCSAYAKKAGEPRCSPPGTTVSCFVDPCMKKAAACQGGRCELVIGEAR